MAFNFDANKTREAAEALTGLVNGTLKEVIVDAYNTCKDFGEGFPLAEDLRANFHKLQACFNDDMLVNAEKLKANMEKNAEFADAMSKVGGATTATAGDMGSVKDSQAVDAARML